MTIQIIDKKNLVFRTGDNEYQFVKPNILHKNFGTIVKAKVKGSTLGWNIEGEWLSYNEMKKSFEN